MSEDLTPYPKYDVFLSFRVVESLEIARKLKTQLESHRLAVFLCDTDPGENMLSQVSHALFDSTLIVVLGTATYGKKTASLCSTHEEMAFYRDPTNNKDYFLLKMCNQFTVRETAVAFPRAISYFDWTNFEIGKTKELPENLVNSVIDRLSKVKKRLGHSFDESTLPKQFPQHDSSHHTHHTHQQQFHHQQQQQQADYDCKVVVLGASGVGKTSLIARFRDDVFQEQKITIGLTFVPIKVTIGDTVVNLNIWDTAGQERFASISTTYLRSAAFVIVVFDITERSTFEELKGEKRAQMPAKEWLNFAKYTIPEGTYLTYLVGNKDDKSSERTVSVEEACAFAEEKGLFYLETSSLSGHNVIYLFKEIAKKLMEAQSERPLMRDVHAETPRKSIHLNARIGSDSVDQAAGSGGGRLVPRCSAPNC